MTLVKRAVAALFAAALAVSLCSCGSSPGGLDMPSGETALTVGSYDVSADEYNYYYYNYTHTDGLDDKAARDAALGDIRRNRAVMSMAEEYGLELSADGRADVESYTAAMMDGVGTDAFSEGLDEYKISRDLFLFLMEVGQLETELRDYAFDERNDVIRADDATVEKDIKENFYAVKQIMIAKEKDGRTLDEASALFEEVAARVMSGEDFDELCAEYNEDDMQDPEYGRYFTHGMYSEDFEKAVEMLNLADCAVVETDVGLHIVKRLLIDSDYVEANFETLRYYYLNRVFNEMLAARAESLEVVWK